MDDFDDVDEFDDCGDDSWGDPPDHDHGGIDLLLDDEPMADGGAATTAPATETGGVHVDPMLLGTGYALYRHGQDRQADRIAAELRAAVQQVGAAAGGQSAPSAAGGTTPAAQPIEYVVIPAGDPEYLSEVVGQAEAVDLLEDWVAGAEEHDGGLPHVLFTAPETGMGRRTIARAAANEAIANMVELSAPFDVATLEQALVLVGEGQVLYIDDLELACLVGPGTGHIARLLSEAPDGACVFGSTSRPELLPGSVAGGFPVHVDLEHYDDYELLEIAEQMLRDVAAIEDLVTGDLSDLTDQADGTVRHLSALLVALRNRAARLGRPLTHDEVDELALKVH